MHHGRPTDDEGDGDEDDDILPLMLPRLNSELLLPLERCIGCCPKATFRSSVSCFLLSVVRAPPHSMLGHPQDKRAFYRQKHLVVGFTRELFSMELVKRIIFLSTVYNVFGVWELIISPFPSPPLSQLGAE